MPSRFRPSLSFLLLGLLASPTLRAQCLSLAPLAKSVAAGRITADSLRPLLPAGQWVEHAGATPYWTYRLSAEEEAEEEAAVAWVGLRRSNQQPHYDLIYKSFQRECITRLRTELRRRGKLKTEFINCDQCEGERLVGDGYTVTVFQQKASVASGRATYPYVLVIRRTTIGNPDDRSIALDSAEIAKKPAAAFPVQDEK